MSLNRTPSEPSSAARRQPVPTRNSGAAIPGASRRAGLRSAPAAQATGQRVEPTPRSWSVGTLTHRLISEHARLVEDANSVATLLAVVHASAKFHVPASTKPTNRILVGQATGLAVRYLTEVAPTSPWKLVGTETRLGLGRADVVWADTNGLILIDEIKVGATAVRVDDNWITQCRTYLAGARTEYGPRVIGVRLVPLAARHLITLVSVDGRQVSLHPTPQDPCRQARSNS